MSWNSAQVSVVVAAYNEASMVGAVVEALVRAGYTTIVVDDGSIDKTGLIADKAGGVVVRHPVNLGQGAALQTGIEFALSGSADVIVTFDADGQHRVDDISVLINALMNDSADFALGSRFLGTSLDQPLLRRILLSCATVFTRLTTGLKITDTHNGFRAMTRRGAFCIKLRQNRMAHASEILHQIGASDFKYTEAPVTIEYSAYSLAKGQRLVDAFSILMDLLARRLQR